MAIAIISKNSPPADGALNVALDTIFYANIDNGSGVDCTFEVRKASDSSTVYTSSGSFATDSNYDLGMVPGLLNATQYVWDVYNTSAGWGSDESPWTFTTVALPPPAFSENMLRSVLGIYPIDFTGSEGDLRQVVGLFRLGSAVVLWAHKFMGYTFTQISKVNGIAVAAIKKIMGV